MADALEAYEVDLNYAIAMAKQATTIATKRTVWAVRIALREAEQKATAECYKTPIFLCETEEACGTGTCLFAKGDLTQIDVPALPGKSRRPQPSLGEQFYSIESAVRPLQVLRYPGGHRP